MAALLAVFSSPTIATDSPASPTPSTTQSISTDPALPPYCGVYCLYAASLLLHHEIPFNHLVKPEYIGCSLGSSLTELEKAAKDHGLYALPAMNLGADFLRQCPHPVVLHAKASLRTRTFNHYVLFLGIRHEHAVILDPTSGTASLPLNDLAARCDGTGLVLSATPINETSLFSPMQWKTFAYLALAMAAAVACKFSRPLRPRTSRVTRPAWMSLRQSAAILCLACLASFAHNLAADDGFLRNQHLVSDIQEANQTAFLPKLSLSQALAIHRQAKATFIDARLPHDYNLGHVPGAINVPFSSPPDLRRSILANLPKNTPIIVYCQSLGCPYARILAAALAKDGYTHLNILRAGWQEWTQSSKPK